MRKHIFSFLTVALLLAATVSSCKKDADLVKKDPAGTVLLDEAIFDSLVINGTNRTEEYMYSDDGGMKFEFSPLRIVEPNSKLSTLRTWNNKTLYMFTMLDNGNGTYDLEFNHTTLFDGEHKDYMQQHSGTYKLQTTATGKKLTRLDAGDEHANTVEFYFH